MRRRLAIIVTLTIAIVVAASGNGRAEDADYTATYSYDQGGAGLDLGGQPLGYPSGMFSSVMARDKILRRRLAALGMELRPHFYLKGFDMIDLLDGQRLKAGLLGDMPTILTAVTNDVAIVALVKQTFSSVITRDMAQIGELKGKRIANAFGSSAHHALLRGLRSVGLSEKDVTLVPLNVDEMPEALARGSIDAFAAWEPAPSIALRGGNAFKVVYRGLSTDYFVLSRAFIQRHPDGAREVVAAFVRALNWMSSSQEALLQSSSWTLADGAAFSGRAQKTTPEQAAAIVRQEILDVASAPVIPRKGADGRDLLQSEFEFLQGLGKIPPGIGWDRVASSFARDLLREVIERQGRYQLSDFDYDSP